MSRRGWVLSEIHLISIRPQFEELSSSAFFGCVCSTLPVPGRSCPCSQLYAKCCASRRSMKGSEQFACCGWYYEVYMPCSFFMMSLFLTHACMGHPDWHEMAFHSPSPCTKPVPALLLGCCVFVWCETEAGTCSTSQIKILYDQATRWNLPAVPWPLSLGSCSCWDGCEAHSLASEQMLSLLGWCPALVSSGEKQVSLLLYKGIISFLPPGGSLVWHSCYKPIYTLSQAAMLVHESPSWVSSASLLLCLGDSQ